MKSTECVLYKGIEVPAKTIEIGKNLTKLIPVSTNRYILHGIPIPRNLHVAEETHIVTRKIISDSKNTVDNNKILVLRYIRKTTRYIRKTTNNYNRYYTRKGEPYGAVVAFLHDGKLKVGWSKRIEGDVLSLGKVVQKEPLVFTKKDAIYIAVLRGLKDSIIFSESGTYTNKNKIIPKAIVRTLLPFLKRIQHVFGQEPNNVLSY
jgi:hypothetical protein